MHDSMIDLRLIIQCICQAIQDFVNRADDSSEVPDVQRGQPTYLSYKLTTEEWKSVDLIHQVLKVRSLNL